MDNFQNSKSLAEHLCHHIGETVTIFTTSGGPSGQGFTGVILSVSDCIVRLTTRIGPAPGCALGNACNAPYSGNGNNFCRNSNRNYGDYNNGDYGNYGNMNYVNSVGSVTDIPIDRIASFVHNAV